MKCIFRFLTRTEAGMGNIEGAGGITYLKKIKITYLYKHIYLVFISVKNFRRKYFIMCSRNLMFSKMIQRLSHPFSSNLLGDFSRNVSDHLRGMSSGLKNCDIKQLLHI